MRERPIRQTRWGPQTLLEVVEGIEIWETVPKVNAAGLVRREIGETVILDSTPYTVTEVTLGGALSHQSGPKVVQLLADEGNEFERVARGRASIHIGAYRERDGY